MTKDWTGNSRSAHAPIGARNIALEDREANDYYATEPKAVSLLLEVERFSPAIWECACGEGHISRELEKAGYQVYSTDLIDRGYGGIQDFLHSVALPFPGFDIITNPPYSRAAEFVNHAMELISPGHKVAMFLKLQFLEGKQRKELFRKWPPKVVYVSSSRLHCAMNGDFERYKDKNAIAYAWYVWEKDATGSRSSGGSTEWGRMR